MVRIETIITLKEIKTDGHAPVLFHCSDGHNYFCKYRITPRLQEINFLAFEIIASILLKNLNIPTPEIALVKIMPDTLDRKKIRVNSRMQEGIIVFGSRQVLPSILITDFNIIHSKSQFKKIINPEDIIRIALFDLWIKNRDRGRDFGTGYNYNLLLGIENKKQQIIAIDHAFILGGSQIIGDFYPNLSPEIGGNLYQTPFFNQIIKHIDRREYISITNNFVTLLNQDYTRLIENTLKQLPKSWELLKDLGTRMNQLLAYVDRTERLAEHILKAKK